MIEPKTNIINVNGGIKIWLAGDIENSAKRMQNRDNLTERDALNVVKKRFSENREQALRVKNNRQTFLS